MDELLVQLNDEQVALMRRHLFLLQEKNERLNLTRITGPDEAWILHVLDSLALLPYVEKAGSPVLDLGTGGGFPGIPLAIVGGFEMSMLDSVAKKAEAVRAFVSELGLSERVEVLAARSEELASERPGHYRSVVARAVAPLAALVEWSAPLLEMGGRLVAAKGVLSAEELNSGKKAAEICGLELVELAEHELPEDKGSRSVAVFEKRGEPSIALPRRVGMARKRPLA